MNTWKPWIFAAALLAAAGGSGAEYGPSGPEVIVDDSASRSTRAVAAGGGFVVVRWQRADGEEVQLVAQRTDGSGTPAGDPFVVAEGLDPDNGIPEGPGVRGLAGGPAGEFQVVWEDYQYYGPQALNLTGVDPSDVIEFDHLLEFVDAPGDVIGIAGSDPQRRADGGFVVSWVREYLDPGLEGRLRARRFAADGSPKTAVVELGNILFSFPPTAAPSADGNFVAVWQHGWADPSIRSRYVAADGSTPLPEVEVSDEFLASDPALAAAPNGEFLVVWESDGSSGDDVGSTSIQGRRLGTDGTVLGAAFQVNSYTTGAQSDPDVVAIGPDGAFLVVWASAGSAGPDGDGLSVQGRWVAPDDGFSAPEFQVNRHPVGDQRRARIRRRGVDEAVVIWRSDLFGPDEIRARAVADPLFADGFESGDVSAWSLSVP